MPARNAMNGVHELLSILSEPAHTVAFGFSVRDSTSQTVEFRESRIEITLFDEYMVC